MKGSVLLYIEMKDHFLCAPLTILYLEERFQTKKIIQAIFLWNGLILKCLLYFTIERTEPNKNKLCVSGKIVISQKLYCGVVVVSGRLISKLGFKVQTIISQ